MSFHISTTGFWECVDAEDHCFDEPLAMAIVDFLKSHNCRTVSDFGCGPGRYVEVLNKAGFLAAGYDGNPKTTMFNPMCFVADLTNPIKSANCDWSLSLEVGEHIPSKWEAVFIDNVCRAAREGIILSWFPEKGHGIGHVNERSNSYVKERLAEKGFKNLPDAESSLREAASLWWFKKSLMVFQKS